MINEKANIIIYDYETDGLFTNKGWTRPIQVALMKITPDNKLTYINKFIKRRKGARPLSKCLVNYWEVKKNPEVKPKSITDLTNITDEQIEKEGFDIKEIFAELNEYFNSNDTVIIGHNIIGFDNKFTDQRFNKYGYDKLNIHNCFDTAGEFKSTLLMEEKDDKESFGEFHGRMLKLRRKGIFFNLDAAQEYYNICVTDKDKENRHNALVDIKWTALILLKQFERYEKRPDRFDTLEDKIKEL